MRYAVATAKSPPAIGSPHGGYTLSTCSTWSVPSDRTTIAANPAATAPVLRQKDVVIWLPSKLQRAARRAGRRGCRQGPSGPADQLFLRGRERPQGPRRPDASRFDSQELRDPGLSAIRGAVARPGKAIRPDVVVANPPDRRVWAHHAELLLDVHFRADAVLGAHILQAGSRFRRDKLPLIEDGVVCAQRGRHIVGLAAVPHDAILIQDLCALGEAHRAPVSAARPELATHRAKRPIAEPVSEVPLMCLVGRLGW